MLLTIDHSVSELNRLRLFVVIVYLPMLTVVIQKRVVSAVVHAGLESINHCPIILQFKMNAEIL